MNQSVKTGRSFQRACRAARQLLAAALLGTLAVAAQLASATIQDAVTIAARHCITMTGVSDLVRIFQAIHDGMKLKVTNNKCPIRGCKPKPPKIPSLVSISTTEVRISLSGRFQQAATKLAMTAVEFPPMQDPASFNLSAVKAQVEAMIKAEAGK
jgi:hypothetical protein